MKKLSLINLESYREVIIEMMRYGGAVDQIAVELKCSEQDLIHFIKSSGLDKLLSRRSWKWKAPGKWRRKVIVSKHGKKVG